MIPGFPSIQVGPLAGIVIYGTVALLAVGLVFGVTTGGAIVFTLLGALVFLAGYFLIQRVTRRLGGAA